MKAILVIDIPEEMLNDNTYVTITSPHSGMSFNAKLKPMPKYMQMVDVKEMTYDKFAMGWNSCLKEIEGESSISN